MSSGRSLEGDVRSNFHGVVQGFVMKGDYECVSEMSKNMELEDKA